MEQIHEDQSPPTGRLLLLTRFLLPSSLYQKRNIIHHPRAALGQVPHRRDQALPIHQADVTQGQALLQTDTAPALLTQQEAHEADIQATVEDHLHIHLPDRHTAARRLHTEQAHDQRLRDLAALHHTEDLRHLMDQAHLLHEEVLLTHQLLGPHQAQDILLADHHIHQADAEDTQATEADIHLAHLTAAAHHTADLGEATLQVAVADTHQAVVEDSAVAEEDHEADADSISM